MANSYDYIFKVGADTSDILKEFKKTIKQTQEIADKDKTILRIEASEPDLKKVKQKIENINPEVGKNIELQINLNDLQRQSKAVQDIFGAAINGTSEQTRDAFKKGIEEAFSYKGLKNIKTSGLKDIIKDFTGKSNISLKQYKETVEGMFKNISSFDIGKVTSYKQIEEQAVSIEKTYNLLSRFKDFKFPKMENKKDSEYKAFEMDAKLSEIEKIRNDFYNKASLELYKKGKGREDSFIVSLKKDIEKQYGEAYDYVKTAIDKIYTDIGESSKKIQNENKVLESNTKLLKQNADARKKLADIAKEFKNISQLNKASDVAMSFMTDFKKLREQGAKIGAFRERYNKFLEEGGKPSDLGSKTLNILRKNKINPNQTIVDKILNSSTNLNGMMGNYDVFLGSINEYVKKNKGLKGLAKDLRLYDADEDEIKDIFKEISSSRTDVLSKKKFQFNKQVSGKSASENIIGEIKDEVAKKDVSVKITPKIDEKAFISEVQEKIGSQEVGVNVKPIINPETFISEVQNKINEQEVKIQVKPHATNETLKKDEENFNSSPDTISNIVEKINEKTKAFKEEESVVVEAVETEKNELLYLIETLGLVENKLNELTPLFKNLTTLKIEVDTSSINNIGNLESLKNLGTQLSETGVFKERISELKSALNDLKTISENNNIDLSKIKLNDIIKYAKEDNVTNVEKLANSIFDLATALESISSQSVSKDLFSGLKVTKANADNLFNMSVAFESIGIAMKNFDDNTKNILSDIKAIVKEANGLKILKEISKNPDNVKKAKKDVKDKTDEKAALLDKLKLREDYQNQLISNIKEGNTKGQDTKDIRSKISQLNKDIEKQANVIEEADVELKKYVETFSELRKKENLINEITSAFNKAKSPSAYPNNTKYAEQYKALKDLKDNFLKNTEDADLDKIKGAFNEIMESLNAQKSTKFVNENSRQSALVEANRLLAENTRLSKEARQKIKDFIHTLKTTDEPEALKNAIAGLKEIKAQAIESGQMGANIFDLWGKKMKQFAAYLGTNRLFYKFFEEFRQGIETVKEFDRALTEMKKVSDESVLSLKQYQRESFELASAVGTKAKQLQDSTADWMRLGESLEEARKSAQTSNVLLNVSEFNDINTATESLVSVSQAFKDLEKSEIVDTLNNVGNNYSIATDGLASALQRSAAVLKTQGNDLYKATALITAGNAINQNPETTARGVRMIALRTTGSAEAKQALEMDGEDLSDVVYTTKSKKQKIIKDYTKVKSNNYKGVDILDENGNYKDTYTYMLEISKIYKELQEEDKKFGSNRSQALVEELASYF